MSGLGLEALGLEALGFPFLHILPLPVPLPLRLPVPHISVRIVNYRRSELLHPNLSSSFKNLQSFLVPGSLLWGFLGCAIGSYFAFLFMWFNFCLNTNF